MRHIQPHRPENSPDDTTQPIPVGRANSSALSVTVLAMLLLARVEPEGVEAVDFMRGSAMLLVVVHAGFHALVVNALKIMDMADVADAKRVLESYRDPRRVSHLDLAAIWLGFYALAPYAL
jgi:hypothetical protein